MNIKVYYLNTGNYHVSANWNNLSNCSNIQNEQDIIARQQANNLQEMQQPPPSASIVRQPQNDNTTATTPTAPPGFNNVPNFHTEASSNNSERTSL